MSKLLCVFLLSLCYSIYLTNGQNATNMPVQKICTPGSLTLTCPTNHLPMVHSAFFGVKLNPGDCSYTPGDCIADGMSSITCLGNSMPCSLYLTKKKLAQCNDQQSDYFQLEYDCVPIVMDDPSKLYDICQSSVEITSDHGIIQSPGYPTKVEPTTIECFRAIHIPDDKTLRLWLTDLYIGSLSTNCAEDHLYVVDNVQTFKLCGQRTYSYPYLCSSTILIQYLVKTDLSIYRGMRLYFEIADRSPSDSCQGGTVTLVPSSTTTVQPETTTQIPSYAQIGIASPIQSFQLCSHQSHTIQCPANYAVAILTNILGVSSNGKCGPHDSKNCFTPTVQPPICDQTCAFSYSGNQLIPSCDMKIADYQYVQYQCIPTNTNLILTNATCSTDGSKVDVSFDRNGRFQSYNYPKLSQMNCTYRLKTKPGYIIHIYALDVSLTESASDCRQNQMTFFEDGETTGSTFCKQSTYNLIYSSCSNELDLQYLVQNTTDSFLSGVDLYFENQQRPLDWKCGTAPSTFTSSTPIRTSPTTPAATSMATGGFIGAMSEVEYDICHNDALNYVCPYGYSFIIVDAYYGVKSQGSSKCGFVQGDCIQEATASITQCQTDSPNCYLPYINKRRLAQCSDQYADYLHLVFQCVPSFPPGATTQLITYDVCNVSDPIRNIHGVITSPHFPQYIQTTNECKRDMFGIHDRLLKVWLTQMSISSGGQRQSDDYLSNPNQADLVIYKTNEFEDLEMMYPSIRDTCPKDYLVIDTRFIAYIYCGTRKLSLEPICTSSATIQYKTSASPNIAYRGFKLYFEWIEKSMDIICVGTPGTIDPSATTTTPIGEPLPPWAQNLDISPLFTKQICLGTSDIIKCPRGSDYVIAIEDTKYAVTPSGVCDLPSASDCVQRAPLSSTCTNTCPIEYIVPKPLSHCQNQTATYLAIDYECLPTRLGNDENPIDICDSSSTDTIALDKGMMISPKYPALDGAHRCTKTIETVSTKIWMIYIVDLFLEGENPSSGECGDASLTINDGSDIRVICGLQPPELVLTSCSNIVQLNFQSISQSLGYRGFKIFFQTIDVPPGWACSPTGFSTTTQQTTIRTSPPTTLIPPTLRIAAYGGTIKDGERRYCNFPFIYGGKEYDKCSSQHPPNATAIQTDSWCSLTNDYDRDQQWGFCDIGVTGLTSHDICRSRTQKLQCSTGYVIDLITADLAAKDDGTVSCDYAPTDCFQSDISNLQTACAGKVSCTVPNPGKSLSSCQHRVSAYFRVEYTCVPATVSEIKTYELCKDSSIEDNVHRGFIISPNFPSTPNNLSCTFDIQPSKARQDIYLYIVEMGLNDPNILGQSCTKDRLITIAGSITRESCGLSFTNRILKTCHAPLTIQLLRTEEARGRGVKLYFEFRDRAPDEICESIITPSTPSTLVPTTTGPSTRPWRPSYFPDPSNIMVKTLCHPDASGAFGRNNFQCPPDYVLVIHRAFYGTGIRCSYTAGDCRHEADSVYRDCSGKQECSVPFENLINLPGCPQRPNNYLAVEYSCLPSLTIAGNASDLCEAQTHTLNNPSGVYQSLNYPSYTKSECVNTTLMLPADSELVIYVYLLDLSIGERDVTADHCESDYLRLTYQCNGETFEEDLCGTQPTKLLFSTCSAADRIFVSYNLMDTDTESRRGFALLYHLLPKSQLSTIAPPFTTTSGKPGSSNTGAIVGGVIGGLIVILILIVGFMYYRKHYLSSNAQQATVHFRPGQETTEQASSDGQGATSSIPYESLKNPAAISVDNPSYKARIPIDDTTTDA